MGVAGEDLGMGIQGVLLCLWRLYRCVRTNMSAEPDFPPSEVITRLSWHRNRNGNGHERSVEERTPRLEAMASDRPTIDVYTIRQTSRRHRIAIPRLLFRPCPLPYPIFPSPSSYWVFSLSWTEKRLQGGERVVRRLSGRRTRVSVLHLVSFGTRVMGWMG